jgi:putative ABC transport system ATP-binding protein
MNVSGGWPEGRPLVEVRGLTCGHRVGRPDEVLAPRDIDLELAPGDVVALTGTGGSGKTSLLRVLAGLEAPAAGQARVGGLDLALATAADLDEYRRRLVGYVAQEPERGLWPSLTAAENVQAPMLVAGVDRAQRRRRSAELLDALGLTGRERYRPAQLTGGERLRLALATALANRPPLLLVDDPAGELDAETVRSLLGDLQSLLRREGTAALIASRGPEVEALAGRVHRLGGVASPLRLPGAAPAPEVRRGA